MKKFFLCVMLLSFFSSILPMPHFLDPSSRAARRRTGATVGVSGNDGTLVEGVRPGLGDDDAAEHAHGPGWDVMEMLGRIVSLPSMRGLRRRTVPSEGGGEMRGGLAADSNDDDAAVLEAQGDEQMWRCVAISCCSAAMIPTTAAFIYWCKHSCQNIGI